MLNRNPNRHRPSPSEEGYILIWVIFLMVLLTLWLSVAIPRTTKAIQRDREVETMHRGKQYIRAVQLYFKKFHAYPPNADALSNTNEMRFLRKKYIDPITGKDDWKAIRFGQNKTPTAMGFFGQPLAGSASTLAGIGPAGGGQSPGGLFQQTPDPTATSTSSNPNGTAGPNGTAASTTGLTGQTFGGAGIIGFSPAAPRPSILIYKKKSQYNEWEFVYDPLSDMRTIAGNTGLIGQPVGGSPNQPGSPGVSGPNSTPTSNPAPSPAPTPGPGSDSGVGSNPGSTPSSGSSGPGSDPGTPPAQPQQ